MPRRSKGPRLWLRKAQYDRDGKLSHAAVWLIKDGGYRESTGSGIDDRRRAEAALANYISRKHLSDAQAGLRPPAQIPVADVLGLYGRDIGSKHSRPLETGQRIAALIEFFGDKVLFDINGALCRAYAEHRGPGASLRTCARRSITIGARVCARRLSRWCCPGPRRRANDGSRAPRRRRCYGPRGVTARCRRVSRRGGARVSISPGSSCSLCTPGRGPVPYAVRRCSRRSAEDGSTWRGACSIGVPTASARPRSESPRFRCRRSFTAIYDAGSSAVNASPSNGMASRLPRSPRRSVRWCCVKKTRKRHAV
jgi:hypothetical protein